MPRVSVIVPAFNAARFLDAALDSVLRQSFGDWECLVVDDCSTDATLEVAGQWMERDDRFHRVSRETNGGVSAARNLGARMTSGELLLFLDADDLLDDQALATLVGGLDAEDHYEVAHGCVWLIDEYGCACDAERWRTGGREVLMLRHGIYPTTFEMIVYSGAMVPPAGGVLMRRSAFEAVGGWDQSMHSYEDHYLWLQLAARHRLLYVPRPTMAYRQDERSKARNAQYIETGRAEFLRRLRALCEARLQRVTEIFGDEIAGPAYLDFLAERAHLMGVYHTPAPIP